MHFSSISPIDRTLLGVTTPGQSGPGSNSNDEVLHIPQSSSIMGTSPLDCLMSYPRLIEWGRGAICVFYSPSQLGKKNNDYNQQHNIIKIVVRK